MERTMIAAALAALALAGCDRLDWREGVETVEACMQRHAPKKGAVDPLADDPGVWVPAYTYDILKMEDAAQFRREIASKGGSLKLVFAKPNGQGPSRGVQQARDEFDDMPATEAGAVLMSHELALYKVRGQAGLYRDLVRQGCEGQRAGMRLISFRFYREDALVDGAIPRSDMSAAHMRRIIEKTRPFQIKDLLP